LEPSFPPTTTTLILSFLFFVNRPHLLSTFVKHITIMSLHRQILSPFKFTRSARRISLPDYHPRREERYDPYCRPSNPIQDFMVGSNWQIFLSILLNMSSCRRRWTCEGEKVLGLFLCLYILFLISIYVSYTYSWNRLIFLKRMRKNLVTLNWQLQRSRKTRKTRRSPTVLYRMNREANRKFLSGSWYVYLFSSFAPSFHWYFLRPQHPFVLLLRKCSRRRVDPVEPAGSNVRFDLS
jgi:hypothetical protein